MKHDLLKVIVNNHISLLQVIITDIQTNVIPTLIPIDFIIPSIPPNGIIITIPGTYKLANDINWYPDTVGSTAIIIIGSDITLDMCNNSIINRNCQNLSTIGILIALGSNITIINGSLYNMGFIGIASIITDNLRIGNMCFSGLRNTNPSLPCFALLVGLSSNVTIEKSHFNSIRVASAALSAIALIECQSITISNIIIKDISNSSGVCAGISLLECITGTISYVNVENLSTGTISNVNSPGHTAIGLVPSESSGLHFFKCNGRYIYGGCDDAHFISLYVVSNCSAVECYGGYVIDGLSGKGAKATGIEVYGKRDLTDSNIFISKCTVEHIMATNPGDKQAAGFSVAGTNIRFENCIASDVRVYGDGVGVGFGWAPDIRQANIFPGNGVSYLNCEAIRCQAGFDQFNHQYSSWSHINSVSCFCHFAIKEPYKIYFCDKCSECPDGPKNVVVNNTEHNNIVQP